MINLFTVNERVSPMAFFKIDRLFIFSVILLLLGFLMPGCSSSSGSAQDRRLPKFPNYEPAEEFLILQKRLERYRKRPREANPPPRFDDRKRNIYKRVKQQQALARQALVIKTRRQRDFARRRYLQSEKSYAAYQNRVVQAEINQAQREEEINKIAGGTDRQRYETYQKNFEAKRLEQLAIQSLREQEAQKIIRRNAAQIPQSPGGGISVSPFSGGPTTQ